MLAASYMSFGIPANAPEVVMVMKENPIQMLTNITENFAQLSRPK